jgi:parallel beta-helix repeat protein
VINLKSKKNQNIVHVLFLLVLFFVGNYYLGNPINNKVNHEINSYKLTNIDILRTSGHWNLSPFVIDDLATGVGAHNWTWAETQPWCSGSGTFEEPYLIENVTIDGENSGNCIKIKNSDKYFRIENCTVFNSGWGISDAGIHLDHAGNGTLINNNCSFNGKNGIFLYFNSDNNSISGNTANNNDYGIRLYASDNNTVSGNTANDGFYGIYLDYSDNNTLSGNTANNNDWYGIDINYSNNNTISGNIVDNNVNYGIIFSSYSDYNLIYKNYFVNNGIHALDEGNFNNWNSSIIGNYWDDYAGVDANDDGIGDTPYIISGAAGSQDNFPIWAYDDDITPVITIISPLSDSVFGLVAPNYQITVDELNLDTIWYTLDGGGTNYTITGLTGTFNHLAWEALSEGSLTIRFYANDTAGNIGFTDVDVIIEIPEDVDSVPMISFGNYYLLFTFITLLSFIILEKRKKK